MSGLRLEAYQPIRRSGSHLGEEAMASGKEEAGGEDEVGEKTQNFGTRHWGEAQGWMSGILVWGTGRKRKPSL